MRRESIRREGGRVKREMGTGNRDRVKRVQG